MVLANSQLVGAFIIMCCNLELILPRENVLLGPLISRKYFSQTSIGTEPPKKKWRPW